MIDQINKLLEDGLKSSPETSRYVENTWISQKIKIKLYFSYTLLMKCLHPTPPHSHLPSVSAASLEGSVLVNMIKLKKDQTFDDYCSEMLILQLQKYAREYDAQTTDVVFDTYKQVSLKSSARKK